MSNYFVFTAGNGNLDIGTLRRFARHSERVGDSLRVFGTSAGICGYLCHLQDPDDELRFGMQHALCSAGADRGFSCTGRDGQIIL